VSLTARAEDWYLTILARTHAHPSYSKVWSQDHMQWFMKVVQDTRETDPSNLDWLNAFVGRIFLGITHTSLVEQVSLNTHEVADRRRYARESPRSSLRSPIR
jgi:ribulose-5-phosphate 4-epimerase/fuculose-1-phosphate aldolase